MINPCQTQCNARGPQMGNPQRPLHCDLAVQFQAFARKNFQKSRLSRSQSIWIFQLVGYYILPIRLDIPIGCSYLRVEFIDSNSSRLIQFFGICEKRISSVKKHPVCVVPLERGISPLTYSKIFEAWTSHMMETWVTNVRRLI